MINYDNSQLNNYAQLLAVLRSLEKGMELSELTELERNILAVLSLEEFQQGARTESLRTHNILDSPTQSSFYRALNRLRDRNFIDTVGDRKNGVYRGENGFWILKNRRIWGFWGCFVGGFLHFFTKIYNFLQLFSFFVVF